jgi:hypothetical protein
MAFSLTLRQLIAREEYSEFIRREATKITIVKPFVIYCLQDLRFLSRKVPSRSLLGYYTLQFGVTRTQM